MKSAEEEMLIFCNNIKYLRKQYGMSKKTMAQIMGVGVGSITQIEHYIIPKTLNVTNFLKLATHLKMKPYEFFIDKPVD